mmetsp:Transcript_19568/g.33589  ORF Transcript_19568/g.33589 Transcript_19568/m.33589 type:complete len:240 (+) Transcript_19568:723-1442(+)
MVLHVGDEAGGVLDAEALVVEVVHHRPHLALPLPAMLAVDEAELARLDLDGQRVVEELLDVGVHVEGVHALPHRVHQRGAVAVKHVPGRHLVCARAEEVVCCASLACGGGALVHREDGAAYGVLGEHRVALQWRERQHVVAVWHVVRQRKRIRARHAEHNTCVTVVAQTFVQHIRRGLRVELRSRHDGLVTGKVSRVTHALWSSRLKLRRQNFARAIQLWESCSTDTSRYHPRSHTEIG